MHGEGKPVCDAIAEKRALDDETEAKLIEAIDDVQQAFGLRQTQKP